MDPVWHPVSNCIIHEPMPGNSRKPAKRVRYHPDTIMARSTRGARMPGVRRAVIDDLDARTLQPRRQALLNLDDRRLQLRSPDVGAGASCT